LIASNLGQIIGRLMYPAERASGEAPRPAAAPAGKRPDRRAQVLELVVRQALIGCGDVVKALGVTSDHAAVILNQLHREKRLVRSGVRLQYRYSLP
jgi:hypothetical protein